MYNRYVNGGFDDFFRPVQDFDLPEAKALAGFGPAENTSAPAREEKDSGLFGGFKLPEFDAETIILLVLVYFLVSEEGDSISDTLLIIGVLLVLGF